MKRYLFNLSTRLVLVAVALMISFQVSASGNWKLHPTFDNFVNRIVDTKNKTYFFCYAQAHMPQYAEYSRIQGYLYEYDKNADELRALTSENILTETIIRNVAYNPQRGYLLIHYDSDNIDLLFDNGKVLNVPALMNTTIPGSKEVNDITFAPDKNRAYLATDFGFISINDEKGEVAESRIYNQKILSMARVGNRYLAIAESDEPAAEGSEPVTQLFEAPTKDAIFSFSDFKPVRDARGFSRILPLNEETTFLVSKIKPEITNDPDTTVLTGLTYDEAGRHNLKEFTRLAGIMDIVPNSQGYLFPSKYYLTRIHRNTSSTFVRLGGSDVGRISGSWDFKEIWFGSPRKGFYSKKINGNSTGDLTRDVMRPNASAAFKATTMTYSPKYGMLVSNHGNDFYFSSFYGYTPILLSGLKNTEWKMYGPPYTNPGLANIMMNPGGLAIDPANPDHVYFGSFFFGIVRLNLADPKDVIHMSSPSDPSSMLPGLIIVADAMQSFGRVCRLSDPYFDADGNLWSAYSNVDAANPYKNELWVWPKANVAATKNPETFKPWTKLKFQTREDALRSVMIPLKHPQNKGKVVWSANTYGGDMVIYDTKGTLDNASDDKYVTATDRVYDQDGVAVSRIYIRCLYEDPETGLVWVGHDSGIYTFNPNTFMEAPNRVNRIKVSRNDGTNLADYLLNGVDVMNITSDAQNRKWICTNGGGVVCTSPDGRTVLYEFNTENSDLPSNTVFSAAWNPDTNSMIFSTDLGLAEYMPFGEGNGADLDNARAYPNPVRPDFFGWVTIDGLVDNALVKITDAAGNLVRELGRAETGSIQWDARNLEGKRVKTGVYYVLASTDSDGGNMAKVTKILVVN